MKTVTITFQVPKLLESVLPELLDKFNSHDNMIRLDTDEKVDLFTKCVETCVAQTQRDIASLKEANNG